MTSQHLIQYTLSKNLYIYKHFGDFNFIDDAFDLINTKEMANIFGFESIETFWETPGVTRESIAGYVEGNECIVAIDGKSGEFMGMVCHGVYNPWDGFDDWPRWSKKTIPSNQHMREIKLICAKRGVGRVLLCTALLDMSGKGYQGAVLEVLGGIENKSAISLYGELGFSHTKAYDTTLGPRYQVRHVDHHKAIIYHMTKLSHYPENSFITLDLISSVLSFTHQTGRNHKKYRKPITENDYSNTEKLYTVETISISTDKPDLEYQPILAPRTETLPPEIELQLFNLKNLFVHGYILEEEYQSRMSQILYMNNQ